MEFVQASQNTIKKQDFHELQVLAQEQQIAGQQQNSQTYNQPQRHQITYHPDIDGLRAVAVSIVVIFHAWPLFMPGGFIGVDIFFVISGYLISGIIIKQTQKRRFSYLEFYNRRIKRIYPALIIVLIFVLVSGTKKLIKRSQQIMSKTMIASTLFAANIQILTAQNDYFDPETQSNPLLHLWSLGVQEQFYIIWPLLLSITLTKFPKKVFQILSAYTILSFVFSIICISQETQFAFYFPFCRFWQMSVGGLIAYLNIKMHNKFVGNLLSLFSVIAIMLTIWILDQDSKFPGFWALIPTLGAAFIIQAGKESFINKYILSNRLFIFIGKISYPLYLWHWPLLVFSRILYPQGSDSLLAKPEVIVLISVIFSIMTYFLIENPIRFRKQRIVTFFLLFIMVAITICAFYINISSNQIKQIKIIQPMEEFASDKSQQTQQVNQKKEINLIDAWIPLQQDYIINKKGSKIPNSSKNPHRQPPTIQKIQQSKRERKYTIQQRHAKVILQKKVDKQSKYFMQKANQVLHHYQVSNEGRQKQLFVIGDSHAKFILNRFQKLYQDSVCQGSQQNFPTVLSIVRQGFIFTPSNPAYNITMQIIEKFKPERIFFVFRWIRCEKVTQRMMQMPQKWTKDYQNIMETIELQLKELKKTGVEIFISGISPCGQQYNPWIMTDENGMIENNMKPLNYSVFRERYIQYFDILDSVVENVGAELVDFTENMCYNSICQVLIPTGYPVTIDRNHQTKLYSRYWAGSVDFLTQFD